MTKMTEKPQPRQIESPYLTSKEVVAYLRLGSLRALTRLIRDHRLPYGRRGRVRLFNIRKLDLWVESRGVEMRGRREG